jgi:hypothetical protein
VNWHSAGGIIQDGPLPASPLREGERTEVRGFSPRATETSEPSPYPLPSEGRGEQQSFNGAPRRSSSFEATVKIRYNHPGTRATVTALENDRAHVRLRDPQRAVTPGQAAVIYDADIVLGGGWICRREALVTA